MCKTVLSAELFTFVDIFDVGNVLVSTLQNIYDRKGNLTLHTNSWSLYGLCISLYQATERRLQTDLTLTMDANEWRGVSNVLWTSGEYSLANDLTKHERQCEVIAKIVVSNNFQPMAQSWVIHDDMEVETTN